WTVLRALVGGRSSPPETPHRERHLSSAPPSARPEEPPHEVERRERRLLLGALPLRGGALGRDRRLAVRHEPAQLLARRLELVDRVADGVAVRHPAERPEHGLLIAAPRFLVSGHRRLKFRGHV